MSEIRNLCTTPYGSQQTNYTWNVDRSQDAETGKWAYMARGSNNARGTFAFRMGANVVPGVMLVCVYSCDNPSLLTVPRNSTDQRISGTDTTEGAVISQRMGWVAGRVVSTDGVNEIWITHECGWVTLEGCAVFAAEDWEHVKQLYEDGLLRMPWFAPPKDAQSGDPVLIP